jgi:hypothetical protein
MLQQVFQLAQQGRLKDASELIKQMVREKQDLKGTNINLAHILLLSCDWDYINALLPPETNTLTTSGHLNSIAQSRPLNGMKVPIPWFTYPAIDFLHTHMNANWKVFEWGSGNSTLWWANQVKSVIAVEDNAEWYSEVVTQMPENAQVLNKKDHDYYTAITEYPQKHFDIIVIDGSSRNECAEHATPYLNEDGLLIFDNSDSDEFIPSAQMLNEQGFYKIDFWGLIPSYLYKNCTTIYFKNPEFLKKNCAPYHHDSPVGISCYQATAKHKPLS